MDRSLLALVDLPTRSMRTLSRPGFAPSTRPGIGGEIHASRPYEFGDDPRRVDWNATARTGELQVRTTLADVAVDVYLVPWLDGAMRFATAGRKFDAAREALAVLASLAAQRNDRVFLRLPGRLVQLNGRRPDAMLARLLEVAPSWDESHDMVATLRSFPLATAPTLVAVIVDPFVSDAAVDAITGLSRDRDVAVVVVSDPAEVDLPPAGALTFADTAGRGGLRADVSSRALRSRYRAAVGRRLDVVRRRLGAAGVYTIEVSTRGEVLRSMLVQLPRRR